ncbi:MAG: flippase [Oscillatoria sp. PMC 1051.18]|nr:flippase [Oscillatoria sp. PMC 1050.18]MEC5031586.1 flippase [Oscillatoria sp. PMC 1051.18]
MTQSSPSQTQDTIRLDILAKDATVALIIQATGLVLTYSVQVILARWMGRTEYGIYEYTVAWSLLLAIPAGLGLPRTVLRLISEYRVRKDWGSLRGIVRGSWLLTLVAGFLLCLGVAGTIWSINYYHSFIYAMPMLVGLGLIPLQALVQLQLETARALEDVPLAYAPSQIVWPILVICGGFFLLQTNHHLNSLIMIAVATVMLFVVVAFQLWFLREKLNRKIEPATPVYAYREWLAIALVLVLQQAFYIILNQTDIIMVGSLVGPGATGIYNAAVKTAMWVSFILQIVNIVAAPAFATLYTQGKLQELQKVVSTVTVWIFWPSLAIAACLLLLTKPILSLFGSDFLVASLPLKVLVLGQVVNAICGSVGSLTVMTGHQNKSVKIFGVSALINLVLNAIAIPRFGAVGAAMTTSFTMVVWNIWLSILVVREIGINPLIFYSFFGRVEDSNSEE